MAGAIYEGRRSLGCRPRREGGKLKADGLSRPIRSRHNGTVGMFEVSEGSRGTVPPADPVTPGHAVTFSGGSPRYWKGPGGGTWGDYPADCSSTLYLQGRELRRRYDVELGGRLAACWEERGIGHYRPVSGFPGPPGDTNVDMSTPAPAMYRDLGSRCSRDQTTLSHV